ncbi:MAG: phosphate ABC transporter permease PstA [Oscillospiraceae bacterium]|nr:phosphate ABC transporter permease PstA [Oscillospiraceae bacterium]
MKRYAVSALLYLAAAFAAAATLISFLAIIADIMIKGLPEISLKLFSPVYDGENFSMLPACINTVFMVAFVMALSLPAALFAAIYLSEYSESETICRLIKSAVQTLASLPSIIYGIFGYLCFTVRMKMGFSFISGALTMSLMVLPIMIVSTQSALASVSNQIREGGCALGATKAIVALKLLVPAAKRGIISGAILSAGKVVGETAALIYTLGSSAEMISGLFSSGRTIAVHIYAMCCEGLYVDRAYAASAVIIIIVVVINALANFAALKSREERW